MGRLYQFTAPPVTIEFLQDYKVVSNEGEVLFRSNSLTSSLEFVAATEGDPDIKQSCRFFYQHKAPEHGWISIFAMEKAGY